MEESVKELVEIGKRSVGEELVKEFETILAEQTGCSSTSFGRWLGPLKTRKPGLFCPVEIEESGVVFGGLLGSLFGVLVPLGTLGVGSNPRVYRSFHVGHLSEWSAGETRADLGFT
ncbi:MAG TPA: hypothetical protein VFE98_01505 [Candidatus Bathyarchaeia archaeon]|nr:hypothetical protein [Candidatus Bathyarchaeia archaeon]